jgi:hypothetical protein
VSVDEFKKMIALVDKAKSGEFSEEVRAAGPHGTLRSAQLNLV